MMDENMSVPDCATTNNKSLEYSLFQNLIQWSVQNHNTLPWRQGHRNLYTTLISELMLQQTTVAGVWTKYENFMAQYPNWKALQAASLEDVLHMWKGLGYYRRPKALHEIVTHYTEEDFLAALLDNKKLPGIGPYTKGALISIGLDQPAAALDANITRILTRYYGDLNLSEKPYEELLQQCSPRLLNEALMDLGREICQARLAKCEICPLSRNCLSKGLTIRLEKAIPSKKRKEPIEVSLIRLVIISKDNAIWGYKKSKKSWLHGYIELPTFIKSASDSCSAYPDLPALWQDKWSQADAVYTAKSTITHHKLRSEYYLFRPSDQEWELLKDCFHEGQFWPPESLWASSSQEALKAIATSS